MIDNSTLLDVEESIFSGKNRQGGIQKDISEHQDQKEIFILILILRFVLQRVFVADIVAKKEEYAFKKLAIDFLKTPKLSLIPLWLSISLSVLSVE
jgi:hypothetical protein